MEWQALTFIWLLVGWRYLFSALALPLRLKRKVIIVGAGHSGRRILDAIRRRPHAVQEPHQVVEIEGRDFIVSKLAGRPQDRLGNGFDPSVLLVQMSPISKTGRSATIAASNTRSAFSGKISS